MNGKVKRKKTLDIQMTSPFWGWRGPLEYSNIWILHRKNGTQSPIFSNCLRKIALGIFSASVGVVSPRKKVAIDLWIHVKVISWAVVSDGFGSLQGASEESLSGAVGFRGRNLQLFTQKVSRFVGSFVKIPVNQPGILGWEIFIFK